MKQVRQGVFETNSSSTHSICIAKNCELEIPKQLHFSLGEFGWEIDTLGDVHSKASYLHTGLHCNERMEDIEKLKHLMLAKGVEATFQVAAEREYFYVDHSDQLKDFLDAVCNDETKMLNFLFSPLSFILTGNDNDDEDVDISVTYEHDEYYKGN